MKEAAAMKAVRLSAVATVVRYSTPWQTSLNKSGFMVAPSASTYKPIDGSLPH